MKRQLVFIFIAVLALSGYTLSKSDEVASNSGIYLQTGWYYIIDEDKGVRRQLEKDTLLFFLDPKPIVTGQNIVSTKVYENYSGNYGLMMKLDDKSVVVWKSATEKSIRKKLAFILNDKLLATPTVMSMIPNGVTALTGNYTKRELQEIQKQIKKD